MKYKVVVWRGLAGTEDDVPMANFTFFKLNDAINSCEAWANIGEGYLARLWDGSIWRYYN